MKKLTFGLIALCLCMRISAQNIARPPKIVEQLLCKKWKADHAVMGENIIKPTSNAESQLIFKFSANKTFFLNDVKDQNAKRTWKYDAAKKIVQLYMKGEHRMNIVSLTASELIMTIVPDEKLPADLPMVKIVYKPQIN